MRYVLVAECDDSPPTSLQTLQFPPVLAHQHPSTNKSYQTYLLVAQKDEFQNSGLSDGWCKLGNTSQVRAEPQQGDYDSH